ncbi:glutathione S-transferase family protein [Halomonas sp. HK25]|uniref:glutathione S-transferase family protein n=1 Tax=Halomonas sp. HK25 TaxID=3394321 RepID=UPI0039FD48F3
MNILHWSPRSPYVRKVMVALHEKGLMDHVETRRTVADPILPPLHFLHINPFGKIPTLERPGLLPLFDSRVILEWADQTGTKGARLFPSDPEERLATLRYEAIGTGMMEVGVTLLIETRMRRNDQVDERIVESNQKKFEAGLDVLESEAEAIVSRPFDAGHIAIGVALCYYDFRFGDRDWRQNRSELSAWHDTFCQRYSVAETAFSDEVLPTDSSK